jgi:hypothetical protein
MTAQELCDAGEQYACDLIVQLNGDTPQQIAVMVAVGALLLGWMIWTWTH